MTKNIFVIAILMTLLILPIIPQTKMSVDKQNSFVLGEIVYQDSHPLTVGPVEPYESIADYGNGTSIYPFVIENKSIDLNNYSAYNVGIEIHLNNSYAIIRNCFITGAESMGSIGVQIWDASNIVIENCIFNYTFTAIELEADTNITIRGNTFLGDFFSTSDYRGYGVNAYLCHNIIVEDNTISHKGHGIVTLEIYDLNVIGNNVSLCNHGIMLHVNTTYANIIKNQVKNSIWGITLSTTKFIKLDDNLCEKNDVGIVLSGEAVNCTLTNNTLISNGNETVATTTTPLASEASGCGILLEEGSTNNTVIDNEFIYNLHNSVDNGEGNYYNHNYWSDYYGYDTDGDHYGDTPYTLEGIAGSVDNHPRGPYTDTIFTTTAIIPATTLVVIAALSGVIIVIVVIVIVRSKRK